ncbi:hypothetical protein DICA4_A04214 [Diutina catenulata]
MAQSSTFEMSTPSGIDESCHSRPNETPNCRICRENYEVTRRTNKVVIPKREYQQLKTLEQNVSTLTQQNANVEQRVLAFERKKADMANEVITLKREIRDSQSETNRKSQECEAKQEQVEKLEQQLQELELKHGTGQVQAEPPIFATDKCPRPLNEGSPSGNFWSHTQASRDERISKLRPNASFSELYKFVQSSLASSRVQDQTCLSPPRIFADPESGIPKPPVEYVFCGRPGVKNLLNEFFPCELGFLEDAGNINDIEGAHFICGVWYLYSRKSSTTYFEFNRATVAKVNYEKISLYAHKYQIWGLLKKSLLKEST